MGNATGKDLHIDKALSEMALGYKPSGFIADMLFPTVRVSKQSDYYYEFSRADRLRRESTERAPLTQANRVSQDIGSGTYFARNFALAGGISVEDKANADPILYEELINGETEYLMDKLLLDKEYRVASMVNSTTNVGSSFAVSSAWNGAGDVLGNINQAIDVLVDLNGISDQENIRVVMGTAAWKSARRDSTVRDIIFGANNGGGYPSREQFRDLLEVGYFGVGGAFENTGQEGLAESLSRIWIDNVLVYYAPDAPTRKKPSYGYSFRWVVPGVPDFAVERHPYDSKIKGEEMEIGYYEDNKLTGSTYAVLITAVNSST
jgi:hypothetical protein